MADINELVEIPDFAGYYASRDGFIYTTLVRGCRDRYNLSKRTEPRKMNLRLNHQGYTRVYMRRESTGKRKTFMYIESLQRCLFQTRAKLKK